MRTKLNEALTEAADNLPDHLVDGVNNTNKKLIAEIAAHYFVSGVRWAAGEIGSRECDCGCCPHADDFTEEIKSQAGETLDSSQPKGEIQ